MRQEADDHVPRDALTLAVLVSVHGARAPVSGRIDEVVPGAEPDIAGDALHEREVLARAGDGPEVGVAPVALVPEREGWKPPVIRTVATDNKGIAELCTAIAKFRAHFEKAHESRSREIEHWRQWILQLLEARLLERVSHRHLSQKELDRISTLVADRIDTQFAGSPKQVADRLEQLRDATGADELIITTITHDHADRVRSYQLLADEWQRR